MIANPTYLEISGRQTGKTSRLLKAMQEHLKVGDVVLYGPMPFPYYMEKLTELPKGAVRFRVHSVFPGASKKLWEGEKLTNPRTFVDDWDFQKDFPIERGGYYCTTLQHLRDYEDTLGDTPFGQLWNLKDVFVSHLSPVNPDIVSARALPESGQVFRTEFTELDTKAGQQDYDDPHLTELGKYLCAQSVLTVCSAADSNPAEVAGRVLFRYMRQNNLVLVEATNPRERNGNGVCPECGRP